MSILIAICCLIMSALLAAFGTALAGGYVYDRPRVSLACSVVAIAGFIGVWVSGIATFITIVVAILRLLGVLS